jgi:hypothetical protein
MKIEMGEILKLLAYTIDGIDGVESEDRLDLSRYWQVDKIYRAREILNTVFPDGYNPNDPSFEKRLKALGIK